MVYSHMVGVTTARPAKKCQVSKQRIKSEADEKQVGDATVTYVR